MRKLLCNLAALAVLLIAGAVSASGQVFTGTVSGTASATGVQSGTLATINNGATSFTLTTTTTGSPASISIKIEGSTDNGTTYNICGSAITSTAAAQATCTGTYDHVRVNVTTLSGGTAPTILWTLTSVNPASVTISQGTPGTTNAVELIPDSSTAVGLTPQHSTAVESGHVAKAGAGNLYSVNVTATVNGLVMVFDSTTVPGDGAVTPVYCHALTVNSSGVGTWTIDTPALPSIFSTGISLAFSTGTNCANKAASATAWFTWRVK